MRRQTYIEYANFNLTFGERGLLDFAERIVLPAFTTGTLSRQYNDDLHFFRDVQLLNLGQQRVDDAPLLVIAGRYIKSTRLISEQRYDTSTDTLQRREEIIEDAPSSIFVLILNNHRLLYVKETLHAPGIQAFETTCLRFLKIARSACVDLVLYDRRAAAPIGARRRISKKTIEREIPSPVLDIVPLGTEESFAEFVDEFDLLKGITVKLITPNHETDFSGFVKALRTEGDILGSPDSSARFQNSAGLSKQNAKEQIAEVATEGHARILLQGTAPGGGTLSGNNENFIVKTPVEINAGNGSVASIAERIVQTSRATLQRLLGRGGRRDGQQITLQQIEGRFEKINQ